MGSNVVLQLHRQARKREGVRARRTDDSGRLDHPGLTISIAFEACYTHSILKETLESETAVAGDTPDSERLGIFESLLVRDLRLEREKLLLRDIASAGCGVPRRVQAETLCQSTPVGTFYRFAETQNRLQYLCVEVKVIIYAISLLS